MAASRFRLLAFRLACVGSCVREVLQTNILASSYHDAITPVNLLDTTQGSVVEPNKCMDNAWDRAVARSLGSNVQHDCHEVLMRIIILKRWQSGALLLHLVLIFITISGRCPSTE